MPNTRFNPQEALICAMVLMAVSGDQRISDGKLSTMARLVQELPVFSDFHPGEIARVTETVLRLLGREDGLDRAYTLILDVLPSRLRETAYLLACEVAAADGDPSQEELRFLQDFRIAMDLDRLIAGAIERAAKARYQII